MKLIFLDDRLMRHTGISGEAMVIAMFHLAQIHHTVPNFPINILTLHRLLLAR